MKAKILSNKKLLVILGIAVALFAAVNIAWWINANASQTSDSSDNQSNKVVYKGRHIEGGGGDKYEFVQGVNMPDFYLDVDHEPEKVNEDSDWDNIMPDPDASICWTSAKDSHLWANSEFWYGGSGDEGSSKFKFSDIEFVISDKIQYEHGSSHYDVIGVSYDKKSPDWLFSKQGVSFFFKLDCYDENGNYIATKRTYDGFRDQLDDHENSEILTSAGHGRGDSFESALELVGRDTMYQAVRDGLIKISIERIVMEQDDDS